MNSQDYKIAIIGLGYVGLPLAVEFGKKYPTIGYDINQERLKDLSQGIDSSLEVKAEELDSSNQLSFTCEISDIAEANIYIVTVPTPINALKEPDLKPLLDASTTVGKVISKSELVIFESTVYPGTTEEECIPLIESVSGLTFNVDFYAGYSERINPGDKDHTIKYTKVTSGSNPEVAKKVDFVCHNNRCRHFSS